MFLSSSEPERVIVGASVDKDVADWIESLVNEKKFRNKSHVIETAICEFKARYMGASDAGQPKS